MDRGREEKVGTGECRERGQKGNGWRGNWRGIQKKKMRKGRKETWTEREMDG